MANVRVMLGRLLAAVVVGTATLLMIKPEPEMHWATPPAGVIRIASRTANTAAQLRRFGFRIALHAR